MRWAILVAVCAVLAVGCSPGMVDGEASYSISEFVQLDGVVYVQSYEDGEVGRPLRGKDLGREFAEVRADVSNEGLGYRSKDGDATFLKPGTPFYTVRGYDPSFRLAVRRKGSLVLYEASSNPEAREGSDLLDVGGKVSGIDVARWDDSGDVLGTIDDPGRIDALVRGIMDAPVESTDPDHFGMRNTYQVIFRLEDGTATVRGYRTDTGRLTPGIMAPKGFREAVKESLEGFLKKREALREASVAEAAAEEQRQARTCEAPRGDGGTRKIDRGGVFYVTNDAPGGHPAGALGGTDEDDRLAGEDGEDEVLGLGGGDTLEGGACGDEVYGGPGDDYLMGAGAMDPDEGGDDVLRGGPGADDINGDSGDDVIHGDAGNDSALYGGGGEDALHGGAGDDLLDAGRDGERDRVYCGAGLDYYVADEIDIVAEDCEKETKMRVQSSF